MPLRQMRTGKTLYENCVAANFYSQPGGMILKYSKQFNIEGICGNNLQKKV
jgi:hypothetical protein